MKQLNAAVKTIMKPFVAILMVCIVLLSVVLVGASPVSAGKVTDSSVQKLKDSLAKASADRVAAETAYNHTKAERATEAQKKNAIEAEIVALGNELDLLKRLIDEYDKGISEADTNISRLQTELDGKLAIMKQRLRASYEDGLINYIELLFSSDGLYELLSRIDRVSYMLDYDRRLLEECNGIYAELDVARSELIAVKADTVAKQADMAARKAQLDERQAELEKSMAALELDVARAYELYRERIAAEDSFNDQVEEALAELQKQTNSRYVGGDFIWPLDEPYTYVSSGFGYRTHPVTFQKQFHKGIDIPAPYKTQIHAINTGTVIETGRHSSNGNYVIIDHGGGIASFYAHLSSIKVVTGQKIECGDTVGLVGMTGLATGYHLHLSIYVNNTAVNPLEYYGG